MEIYLFKEKSWFGSLLPVKSPRGQKNRNGYSVLSLQDRLKLSRVTRMKEWAIERPREDRGKKICVFLRFCGDERSWFRFRSRLASLRFLLGGKHINFLFVFLFFWCIDVALAEPTKHCFGKFFEAFVQKKSHASMCVSDLITTYEEIGWTFPSAT